MSKVDDDTVTAEAHLSSGIALQLCHISPTRNPRTIFSHLRRLIPVNFHPHPHHRDLLPLLIFHFNDNITDTALRKLITPESAAARAASHSAA